MRHAIKACMVGAFLSLLLVMPPPNSVSQHTFGYVTPPFGDISTLTQNSGCSEEYYGGYLAGGVCVDGSTYGAAYIGDVSAAPSNVYSNSEYVLFDQNGTDGAFVQPPIYSAITMTVNTSFYGVVDGSWAESNGIYSADANLKVMFSYTYYNTQTSSYQTVNYLGTIYDLDSNGVGAILSCSSCVYTYTVVGNPPSSLMVGGGMGTSAFSDAGFWACSYFTDVDPFGYCGPSSYSMSVNEIAGAAWSISLTSMSQGSSTVSLKATASAPVNFFGEFINIFDQTTDTLITTCNTGTTCVGSLTESGSKTQNFIACVGSSETCANSLASAVVSVTWPLVSISTQLSSSSITAGGSAHDTATLSNQKAHASGSVKYAFYSGSSCSGTSTTVSNVTVTNGVVPPSQSHTFNTAGSYSWQAVYSGDSTDNGATSQCESLTVTKANPSLSTALSPNVILPGGSVYDTATLSGETSNAGGTVNYSYTSGNPSCNHNNPVVVNTVTVTNGVVPLSNSVTLYTTGFYYWWAVYSGDSNNNGATGPCEVLYVGETGGGCVITGMANALVNETLSNDKNTGQLVPHTMSSNSGPIPC